MVLWTQQHINTLIPSFIVMLVLGFVLRMFLRKKSEKIRMIPFQICAVIIFVLEIIKQVKSYQNGYDLYHIPLHFCSLFIFMLPLMAFYHGKHKYVVRAITTDICAALFIFMAVYPDLIYGAWNIENFFNDFFDFHTVAFHTVATFTFVLIVALDLHKPNYKRDAKAIFIFIACYCVIAASMAQILQTNFNNFYQCNIAPLQAVKMSLEPVLGATITQILYVLIVCVLDLAFTQVVYAIYRILRSPLKRGEDIREEYDELYDED